MRKILFIAGLAFFGTFVSCEELEVTEAPEQEQDSLYLPEDISLNASAIIGGRLYTWDNEELGYGNGVGDSAYGTACYIGGILKEQSFYFANFTDSLAQDSIFGKRLNIQIAGCAPIGSTSLEEDSIINVGPYTYGNPYADSNGVVVTFVDDTGAVWSTVLGYGLTGQTGSTFTITDKVDNIDGFSKWIIAGDFSCTLYDIDSNALTISEGSFTSRVGKE